MLRARNVITLQLVGVAGCQPIATSHASRWAIWAMPKQVGFEPCGRVALGNLGYLFSIAQSAQNWGALGHLGNLGIPNKVGGGPRRALHHTAI